MEIGDVVELTAEEKLGKWGWASELVTVRKGEAATVLAIGPWRKRKIRN